MRKLIFFLVTIIIVAFGAYMLLSYPGQKSLNAPSVSPSPSAKAMSINERTLSGLSEALGLKAQIREYNYADWKETGDYPQPLMGNEIIVGTMSINGIGQYKGVSPDNLNSITTKTLAPLIANIETYFTSQGFTKNTRNSRTVNTDGQITTYLGYEKGNTKCILRIDDKTDPFGNFACGTIDTRQQKLQTSFTSLFLGPRAEDKMITSFRVQKIENDFATGSANGELFGYVWIAKKTGSTWKVVWKGNDAPSCGTMKELNIPKAIYLTCYES